MSFNVVFYTFPKKANSTARPTDDNIKITAPCVLLEQTNILTPKIRVRIPANISVKYLNYAHIADFDRWYYVTNWETVTGCWVVSLKVDVLASWKNGIGRSTEYISRSGYASNEKITDTAFPLTTQSKNTRNFIDLENSITRGALPNLNSGLYVVTVLNNLNEDVTEKSIVTYYALTATQYKEFCNVLSSSDIWGRFLAGTLELDKYILGVKWYPYAPRVLSSIGSLRDSVVLGDFPLLGVQAYQLGRVNTNIAYDFTFPSLPNHPQIDRGSYMNCDPFTNHIFYYPPIGHVTLDSKLVNVDRSLNLNIYVDLRGGDGNWMISNDENIIASGVAKFSADIPIGSNGLNISSIANSVASIAGGVFNASTGNFASGVAQAVGGVGGAIGSALSGVSGSGKSSGIYQLCTAPVIYTSHNYSVDINPEIGKPLCSYRTINTLPGYMEIPNPKFALDCTKVELDEIATIVKGGFYFE